MQHGAPRLAQLSSDGARRHVVRSLLPAGLWRVLLAVLAAGGWMLVSSVLILLNKHLMVTLHFAFPMAVSGMGMCTSGLLSFLVCKVGLVEAKTPVAPMFWLQRILPVGFFMALTLWTGNEVYMYLTVAFIQMLKAFTPVITMLCLVLARLESPNTHMVLSVLLTAAGTAVAAWGEVNMSMLGMMCMLASETAEAIRLVMTQYLLTGLRFHPIEGLMYLAPACTAWLVLGVAVFEWPRMRAANALSIVGANPGLFMVAAVMGFAVNALAYTTIKLASSLTLKVLGTAKNTLLVVVGVLLYGELVAPLQGVGYAVSLAGFAWYNQLKLAQIAAAPVLPVQGTGTGGGERKPLSPQGSGKFVSGLKE